MPFVIIGMRRSGTSILRNILLTAPEVTDIEFEPPDLWSALVSRLPRMVNKQWVGSTKGRFLAPGGLHGAKFAINPGCDAVLWQRMIEFEQLKFVFIRRNSLDTYRSWVKVDEGRQGSCVTPEGIHRWFWDRYYGSFRAFADQKPERAVVIDYEDLFNNPVSVADNLNKLLGTTLDPERLRSMLHKPENTKGLPCSTSR